MNKKMRDYCVADLKATYELHQRLNQPPPRRTIRRVTVVAITFSVTWLLFVALDVLARGYNDSYVRWFARIIYLAGAAALGHNVNFIG